MIDAIVIGAGPNGLVAANLLADAGWEVLVLEAQDTPGGAIRSGEMLENGFVNDHCSAFYPLGAGSPVMKALRLEDHGLRWCNAPLVLAHPATDGSCPVISRDLDETAESLGPDGDVWRRLYGIWDAKGADLLDALFTPFPPVRASARLAKGLAWKELLRLARFATLPVRRLGEEYFEREESRRLLAGLALHADLLPESSASGFFGYLLAALGQSVGFPSPEGGAGNLTTALVNRLQARGGALRCNAPVRKIVMRSGRATGVELADGSIIKAGRAVLADVDAPTLYLDLIPRSAVPADVLDDVERYQRDSATVKVDWNLDAPIPWLAPDARRAGTVHVAESIDELSITASELLRGVIPTEPFLLFGQQSMVDSTRQPSGRETAWAYTHVPQKVRHDGRGELTGKWNSSELERFADRMQARVESLAPGFGDLVRGRAVIGPADFEKSNANLVNGALGGGTAQLHQQLVFRPIVGLARPETCVPGLYLASASAHPGGGVHGACGANAAHAALHGLVKRRAMSAVRWAAKFQGRKKASIL